MSTSMSTPGFCTQNEQSSTSTLLMSMYLKFLLEYYWSASTKYYNSALNIMVLNNTKREPGSA